MNIVMIGPFGLRPKGTMAVRALPLARALSERGHRVSVILPPWSYPQDSGRVFSDGDVQVINITLPRRVPGLWHLVVAWRLVRAALAQRPDVVHCFKPKGHSGLAALVLWLGHRLGLTRVRLVVDSDDWEGRGGWNEIERYSRVQKAFFAWQEHWGLTHAGAVTVASRALQSIVWSMGVQAERVFYVPNGVWSATNPLVAGDHLRREDSSHSTVLLYTRFFEFAVERVVRIVTGVLNGAPEARLVVVGAGLFGEEKQFMAQVAAAGLADRVAYEGWSDPSELPGYFASADVAIHPFDDTLINRAKCSVKLTELLAAGLPVVADRVGQNAEYIEHGVSGILVDAGDTDAFVAAVVRLLADSEMRRTLGEQARRRMTDHFSWTRLASTVEDAYTCINRRLLSLWLPVALWMAAIFIGSSQQSLPSPESHILDVLLKKTGHVLEYAVLGFLLWRACHGSVQPAAHKKTGSPATQAMPGKSGLIFPSILTVVLGVLYAVTDELHQLYVPTRSGNARDVLIDATAVALGVILMVLWRRFRSRSPR